MAELTLCRSIILDSGEIVPAGTILKDYGDLTSRSIAPSQAPLIEELRSKHPKDILTKFESKHIIDFFRISRECVLQASTSGSLKKKWVKGDERVAPFPCFVRATKMCEERSIELIDAKEPFGPYKRKFFDKNFGEIIVFTISSLDNLTIGSQWRLGGLKSISKLLEHISSYATVIGYYYPNTDYIKVEPLLRRKFYVELRSYRYERTFDELSVGQVLKGSIRILGRGEQ